jgi:hypothetical protein
LAKTSIRITDWIRPPNKLITVTSSVSVQVESGYANNNASEEWLINDIVDANG